MYKIDLNNNWMIRSEELAWGPEMSLLVLQRNEGWFRADLPCDIHMPLIECGIIKEPLEAENCFECEWMEEKSWWFKKVFDIDDELLASDAVELTLESLDAEADVFLNGIHLGHQRSAHYAYVCDVKSMLQKGENALLVRLSSGLEHYSEFDISAIKKQVITEANGGRGDKRRAFVRKPQFVYGWDWGPKLATCGIMKGARIEGINKLAVRSVHVFTKSVLVAELVAELGFEIDVENMHPYSTRDALVQLQVDLGRDEVLTLTQEVLLRSGINYIEINSIIKDIRLWWPNGMGEQPLYTINAWVVSGETKATYPPFKYGVRTLKLNQGKIGFGERRFAIEINGIRTFCKGGNWIPADSIYARVTDEKYDTLIHESKEANFNMLRIWGGGLYERDIFYEKCDEYGIMLWHDFMFACAMYPDNMEWFRNEVEKEMEYQTRRLRNHCAIVLWCGNNENHWAFDEWWINENKPLFMGGIKCYNEIAPRIVQQNCPEVPYWNSSPYGGEHPNESSMGDRHHWHDCTMNPDMEKRITPEEYDMVSAKFVSEYGYIGPCRKSSIIKYHGGASVDWESRTWKLHNNTFEKETVPAGIAKHYTDPSNLDIDEYLLYAGLCQGLMYGYSLEAMRFNENCSGSLFWMYDDCWGEVGWTIIDYYLKRKISYYFVKRAFAPVRLIMREKDGIVKVMGINDTAQTINFMAEYGYSAFDGKYVESKNTDIKLNPFSRGILLEFGKGNYDFSLGSCFIRPEQGVDYILPAILRSTVFRNIKLIDAELELSNYRSEGNTAIFTVYSNVYTHAVHFNLDDNLHLSDEYFDLLPGEKREVIIYNVPDGFSKSDIKIQYIR